MEKVKVNSVEENYTCYTCLSTDRKLYPLGEFADVYFKICSHTFQLSLSKTVICWECAKIMKKFKLFQKKAEYAQNLISLFQTKKNVLLKSLSTLKNINISTENIINMVFAEETENKYLIPIPHIKEELDTDVDNNDVDYTDDLNHDLSDVKEEITELIKNENCDAKKNYYVKRPKQYRYVCDKISKNDLARLTRTVPIELCEIKNWLEREKEIEVYKNSKFKCESCVYSWSNEKGLLEHRKKYHDLLVGTYICDICTSRFPNKRSLSAHLSRHLRMLECAACRMRMCAPRHMARHLAAHTRKLQCVTCGALNFSNIRQLYKHNRTLHRIFICDHCGKKCKWRRTMEKHMRRHFETYECKICVRRYKNRASYRKHYDTKHRIATTEDAYCAPCGKQFNNVSLYRRHLGSSAAHASERDAHRSKNKIACPECGREYSRKAYMMNHYKHVHLNQSNFYCQQCDRYFLNRTRYTDHMRYKHEGIQKEKNKLCNICGRGFAANRTLIHHIRTHSGERPFECEFCSGKFSQKHAMLSHVKHVHLKSKRRVRWQQEVS